MTYDINGTIIEYLDTVYNYLAVHVFRIDTADIPEDIHKICADVQDWCELATIDETYENDMFTINIVDY